MARPPVHPMRYAVTFEYDTLPPTTAKGTIPGRYPHTGARMAVQDAARALHPCRRWRSLVVVLERTPSH